MVDAVPLKHHPDALAALQQLSASESVAEAMQRQRPAEAFGQAILVQVFWSRVSQKVAALVSDCTSIEEQLHH